MNTQTAEILVDTEDLAPEAPSVQAMLDMTPTTATESADPEPDAAAADDDVARLVPLVEGLLFAAGVPVPVARLVEALDGPDRRQVLRAMQLLGDRLEAEGRGLRLVRVAGGYQLRTL